MRSKQDRCFLPSSAASWLGKCTPKNGNADFITRKCFEETLKSSLSSHTYTKSRRLQNFVLHFYRNLTNFCIVYFLAWSKTLQHRSGIEVSVFSLSNTIARSRTIEAHGLVRRIGFEYIQKRWSIVLKNMIEQALTSENSIIHKLTMGNSFKSFLLRDRCPKCIVTWDMLMKFLLKYHHLYSFSQRFNLHGRGVWRNSVRKGISLFISIRAGSRVGAGTLWILSFIPMNNNLSPRHVEEQQCLSVMSKVYT